MIPKNPHNLIHTTRKEKHGSGLDIQTIKPQYPKNTARLISFSSENCCYFRANARELSSRTLAEEGQ